MPIIQTRFLKEVAGFFNEIDAYIGFIKNVAKAKGNRKQINKAIAQTGMTETRLLYIKMKTDVYRR